MTVNSVLEVFLVESKASSSLIPIPFVHDLGIYKARTLMTALCLMLQTISR